MKVSAPNSSSLRAEPAHEPLPVANDHSGDTFVNTDDETLDDGHTRPQPPLAERQNRAAAHLLSQVADLLANVQDGIRRNVDANEPARANHRLLMTAVGLVGDMVETTRVAGKRIFVRPAATGPTPIEVYSRITSATADQPTDFVLAAKSMVREVDRTLKGMPVSTTEDVSLAFPLLGGLEHRVRTMRPGTSDPTVPVNLDRHA